LHVLCGGPAVNRSQEEFGESEETSSTLLVRWRDLQSRIETALARLPPSALDGQVQHPRRGPITGRQVLLVVARHAAEHLGQAELTRDLHSAWGKDSPG